MPDSILKLTSLRKAFPGVLALDSVDFDLRRGEIHAVVGKNGAGKSTLISIISGSSIADGGSLEFDGEAVDVHRLRSLPIATVYQESAVFPNRTVTQNAFAGNEREIGRGAAGRAAAEARTEELLAAFGLRVRASDLVATLSPVEQKVVAIIRALVRKSKVLILDEPTAVLSLAETERLFTLLRALRHTGLGIIYISHRLDEIFQIADRVTVLRDGRVAYAGEMAALDMQRLVGEIVGPDVATSVAEARPADAVERKEVPARFEARGLRHAGGRFDNISLKVWPGEIVGLAGLIGAGKTEIGKSIFGAEKTSGGDMLLDDVAIDPGSPAEAIRRGIVYVTEDRKHEGLFGDMTIAQNVCAPLLAKLADGAGMIDRNQIRTRAMEAMRTYRIKATSPDQIVATLSGGNQQKVLMARWLQMNPKLLIVDEPTVGVDVSARQEIYRLIRRIAESGAAVIFASCDLKELLDNTDRIVTLYRGRMTGSYVTAQASESLLVQAVSGLAA